MRRREIIIGSAAMSLATPQFAAEGFDPRRITGEGVGKGNDPASSFELFKTISNPIPSDARVIRFFLLFTCPFCRAYHSPVGSWASTLPKSFRYEPSPVVFDKNTMIGAIAYYGVRRNYPGYLAKFMENAFINIQDKGRDANNPDVYLESARQAGIPIEKLIKNFSGGPDSEAINALTMLSYSLTKSYEIKVVPTLAVGGSYTTTPDSAAGDMQRFILLSSAVVSMHMQKSGIREI